MLSDIMPHNTLINIEDDFSFFKKMYKFEKNSTRNDLYTT